MSYERDAPKLMFIRIRTDVFRCIVRLSASRALSPGNHSHEVVGSGCARPSENYSWELAAAIANGLFGEQDDAVEAEDSRATIIDWLKGGGWGRCGTGLRSRVTSSPRCDLQRDPHLAAYLSPTRPVPCPPLPQQT